ncbi:MAG: hypothetical protein COB37_02980 [Kordiimonadales bacterium]|nr:MAG: hypothetical protein COB37_02980 [Kordiimonadales bacterium]
MHPLLILVAKQAVQTAVASLVVEAVSNVPYGRLYRKATYKLRSLRRSEQQGLCAEPYDYRRAEPPVKGDW